MLDPVHKDVTPWTDYNYNWTKTSDGELKNKYQMYAIWTDIVDKDSDRCWIKRPIPNVRAEIKVTNNLHEAWVLRGKDHAMEEWNNFFKAWKTTVVKVKKDIEFKLVPVTFEITIEETKMEPLAAMTKSDENAEKFVGDGSDAGVVETKDVPTGSGDEK